MKDLPVRKSIRLRDYDYSQAGCYFITICVNNGQELLGRIVGATVPGRPHIVGATVPGRPHIVGATVPGRPRIVGATVPGRPHMELSELGENVDAAIGYYITNKMAAIDKYVIMPNHVHLIIVIQSETGDRGRSPLQYVVRNLKSYVTKTAGFSPWQRSFHDHIIRYEAEYQRIWRYIDENPQRWNEDRYYTKQAFIDYATKNDIPR